MMLNEHVNPEHEDHDSVWSSQKMFLLLPLVERNMEKLYLVDLGGQNHGF